jgi:hypothetical protein
LDERRFTGAKRSTAHCDLSDPLDMHQTEYLDKLFAAPLDGGKIASHHREYAILFFTAPCWDNPRTY